MITPVSFFKVIGSLIIRAANIIVTMGVTVIISDASTGELFDSPTRKESWFVVVPNTPLIMSIKCSFNVNFTPVFKIAERIKKEKKANEILSRDSPKGSIHCGVSSLEIGILNAKNIFATKIRITPLVFGGNDITLSTIFIFIFIFV